MGVGRKREHRFTKDSSEQRFACSCFRGDSNTVIHPGTTRGVVCIDYVGAPDARPARIEIEYQLAAEGTKPEMRKAEFTL